jgi:hypothetical protein
VQLSTVALGLVCLFVCACGVETPTQPAVATLLAGTWTGQGCLSVASDGCDLVVGCGHGRFPIPVVRADGTFDVEGTYRVEAGPVSIDPAPPATFSGVVKGQTLTLTVTSHDASGRPTTSALQFVLQFSSASGRCVTACV